MLLTTAFCATPAFADGERPTQYNVYLGQAIEAVNGLASSNLVDNTTMEPSRKSDLRSATYAGVRGIHSVDNSNTFDFGYTLNALIYNDKTQFNYLGHTVDGGYTRRLNDMTVIGIRGGINRSFANTGYDPYYWRGHTGLALAQSYDKNLSVVYGIDIYRYAFAQQDGLNATQSQFSITPSYVFTSIPAVVTVIMRATNSKARRSVNGYNSVEILPQVTYQLGEGAFLRTTGNLGHAGFDAMDSFQAGVKRADTSYGGSFAYYAPIADTKQTGNLMGYARYSYNRNDSTLDRQDYDNSVISLGVTTRF